MKNKKQYVNLGYWKDSSTYDQATEALVELVGVHAKLNSKDILLDAGFGYGGQDVYWMKKYKLKEIDGMNTCKYQQDYAMTNNKMTNINYFHDDVLNVDKYYQNNYFTKVIALESSFHFKTREDFFKKSYNKLKLNGTLTLADVIVPENRNMFMSYLFHNLMWYYPSCNKYNLSTYVNKLKKVGFRNIKVKHITNDVYEPLSNYLNKELEKKNVKDNLPFIFKINNVRKLLPILFNAGWPHLKNEYVIITCEKIEI